MTQTEETFKLSIKETCAEIRHVQSKMNAIVARYIEDTVTDDTETVDIENLRHDMLLSLRHYQDTLFATINLLRHKYDHLSRKLRAKLASLDKTCPETQNGTIRPII